MAHRLPEGDDCPHVYCRKQAWGRFLDIVYTEVTTLGCAPSEVGQTERHRVEHESVKSDGGDVL